MTKEANPELAASLRDFQKEKPLVRESRDRLLALRGQVEMLVLQLDDARTRVTNAEYQHSLKCRPADSDTRVKASRENLRVLCDALDQQLLALQEVIEQFHDLSVAMEATVAALNLLGSEMESHNRRIPQLRVTLADLRKRWLSAK